MLRTFCQSKKLWSPRQYLVTAPRAALFSTDAEEITDSSNSLEDVVEEATVPESTTPESDKLRPQQVVAQLNQYIIGQDKAKRAVAIALRNRWRRQKVSSADLR